jgi:cell division protein FtsB
MRFISGRVIALHLGQIITFLAQMEKNIMAQIDDLKTAVAAQSAATTQILALVASQNAEIADLKNQLAAAPDLAPVIADVMAETAAMAAVLPPAPAP